MSSEGQLNAPHFPIFDALAGGYLKDDGTVVVDMDALLGAPVGDS